VLGGRRYTHKRCGGGLAGKQNEVQKRLEDSKDYTKRRRSELVGEAATTYSWLYSGQYDPLKASSYSSGPRIVEQATKPRFAHPSQKMALGFSG
jgi:hypothetical protein